MKRLSSWAYFIFQVIYCMLHPMRHFQLCLCTFNEAATQHFQFRECELLSLPDYLNFVSQKLISCNAQLTGIFFHSNKTKSVARLVSLNLLQTLSKAVLFKCGWFWFGVFCFIFLTQSDSISSFAVLCLGCFFLNVSQF